MLVSVPAPAPPTNCERRVARRTQRHHNLLGTGCGREEDVGTSIRAAPTKGSPVGSPHLPKHPTAQSPSSPHFGTGANTGTAPPCRPPQRDDEHPPPSHPPQVCPCPQPRAGPCSPTPTPLAGTNIPQAGKQPGEGGEPWSGRGFYLLMTGFFSPALTADPLISISLPQANTFQSNITLHPD